ncbi:aspartate/glutamate racemase family protein [Variovorax sp. RT4R15]|uniref:aspartate/glutamate racemase family protein n=1 Tax=Variovorax sp. RT4R15 TaxID=3443737 RepID=UPI003F4836C6
MDMAKTGAAAPGLLGVLGGMGPLATLDFMHKLLAATPAASDQEHVPVLVSSIPQVPDRTAAFRGEGASPLPAMIESGRRLVDAGAGLIVMPCNTAHLWFEPLQQALGLPMLHLVDAAIEQAIARTGAGAPLGLLATDATIASGLYLNRAPAGAGLHWLLPTAREMIEQVMPGIEAVKAGDRVRGAALLGAAGAALATRGAGALVLGCTEIPLVLDDGCSPVPTIDATAALAQRCVAWSRGQRAAGAMAA